MPTKPHVLIIEARFYDENADQLLAGAKAALDKSGATYEVLTVPGILELPPAAHFAFTKGAGTDGRVYNGLVVLGCAVKGETDHYEHVCRESMAGVRQVSMLLQIPTGNGILTCPTWELAQARANPKGADDVGGRAARACLRMIEVKQQFSLQAQPHSPSKYTL
ncbi:MAG: 6,7-dimethyl-8-ribityllumazine synthase [Rhodospirillaceae bacterium]|nr:6,7-dimethyl-8-ribityllumazine synthase [Rhodospirillaceae bacterium]